MRKKHFLSIFLLCVCVLVETGAAQEFTGVGPGSLIASIDSNCVSSPTQFFIGEGLQAVQFNLIALKGGNSCITGEPSDVKGFSLRNREGIEFYRWHQVGENLPSQPLGPLDILSVSSGSYTLQVIGGRDAQVILRFNVVELTPPTPSTTFNDSDGDGVIDQWDLEPNTPPNSLVDRNGRAGQAQNKDADGDGVIDALDMEPNTPPNSLVDRNGRAGQTQNKDSDGDGVIDQWDLEPNTLPNSYVDRNGRAVQTQNKDSDGDGVIDQWDMEPNTPSNSFVDRNGRAAAVSSSTAVAPAPVKTPPEPQPTPTLSSPWDAWLGFWEVTASYSGCPGGGSTSWWLEVSRLKDGYVLKVQSGHGTKVTNFTANALEFKVSDDVKTEVSLWLSSDRQCEGTIYHPGSKECQRGTIRAQKR